jgi:hypothetical protein
MLMKAIRSAEIDHISLMLLNMRTESDIVRQPTSDRENLAPWQSLDGLDNQFNCSKFMSTPTLQFENLTCTKIDRENADNGGSGPVFKGELRGAPIALRCHLGRSRG